MDSARCLWITNTKRVLGTLHCLPVDFDIQLSHPGKSRLRGRVRPLVYPWAKNNRSIIPRPSMLVLLLVVVLVFVLVSCCCRCLHRLCCHVADANLVGNSDFWFRFLGLPSQAEFRFCVRFRRFRLEIFQNSDVWRVRKSGFQFAIFGILVFSLRRNSVHLIVANLYWLQSMYNDIILIVHKLVAPLQH